MAAGKVLYEKAFKIVVILSIVDINVDFHQWFCKLFGKTSRDTSNCTGGWNYIWESAISHLITQAYHTYRISNSSYWNKPWVADLADMQLISKYNKRVRFLLCIIDTCSKYAWVVFLKDKKDITITNEFQKILDECCCKPSKIWVDNNSEFYNRSMKF